MDLANGELRLKQLEASRLSHAKRVRSLNDQLQAEYHLNGPSAHWAVLQVARDGQSEAAYDVARRRDILAREVDAERARRAQQFAESVAATVRTRTDPKTNASQRLIDAIMTDRQARTAVPDGAPSGISDEMARRLMLDPRLRWTRQSDMTLWYYDQDDEMFYEIDTPSSTAVKPPPEQMSEALTALREAALGDGVWRLRRGS